MMLSFKNVKTDSKRGETEASGYKGKWVEWTDKFNGIFF